MIQILFFMFVGIASVVAFSDWRKGLVLMLVAGAMQDPVRKLIPGAPSYMVLAFLPIWFAICLSVLSSSKQGWRRFAQLFPKLRSRMQLFLLALILALCVLLVQFGLGVWQVGVIGFIGYAFPLLTLVVGFYFAGESGAVFRLMRFYCLFFSVYSLGGVFQYYGYFPDWQVVGTDSLGMTWVRHVPGYIVSLNSGFSRSPDIMGWHAAMLTMFSLMLAQHARYVPGKAFWLAMATWGLFIVLISGRNKMIFMPVVFVAAYGMVQSYRGGLHRAIPLMLGACLVVGSFYVLSQRIEVNEVYFRYVGVGASTLTERSADRSVFSSLGTVRQSGVFGLGLGSASTGARHGGNMGDIRAWQESGLPKLFVELGIPGVLAVFALGLALYRLEKRSLDMLRPGTSEQQLFVGLLAVLTANLASFSVSHQVFGDPFIVILVGFLIGVSLSVSYWPGVAISVSLRPNHSSVKEIEAAAR